MKSKFFKDTQGLESAFESCTPDKVSVCLRLSRTAYELALAESAREGLTSGEYIERLICQRAPRRPEADVWAGTAPPAPVRRPRRRSARSWPRPGRFP